MLHPIIVAKVGYHITVETIVNRKKQRGKCKNLFFRITQYTRTHTCTQPYLYKHLRMTEPANPRD